MTTKSRMTKSIGDGPVFFVDSTPDGDYARRILSAHLRGAQTVRMDTGVPVLDDAMNAGQADRERILSAALEKLGGPVPLTQPENTAREELLFGSGGIDEQLPIQTLTDYLDRHSGSCVAGFSPDGSAERLAARMNDAAQKRCDTLRRAIAKLCQ